MNNKRYLPVEHGSGFSDFFQYEPPAHDCAKAISQMEKMMRDLEVATRLAGQKLGAQLDELLEEIQSDSSPNTVCA